MTGQHGLDWRCVTRASRLIQRILCQHAGVMVVVTVGTEYDEQVTIL